MENQNRNTQQRNSYSNQQRSDGASRPTSNRPSTNSSARQDSRAENRRPNTNPPNKKKRKKRRRRGNPFVRFLIYMAFVLGSSAILSIFAVKWSNDVFAFSKADYEITIKLSEDATVSDVSKILDDSGVIDYGFLFKLFVNVSAKNSSFIEGTHTLSSDMDYRGILNSLAQSTNESRTDTVKVTIPEGYSVEQIALRLEEASVVSAEDFLDTAVNHEFLHDFLTTQPDVRYQLEGYLFPDTYEFYENDTALNVINKMLNNFEAKIQGDIVDLAEIKGLSMHEVVTIASIIEREAAKQDEQAKISGVIDNRLNNWSEPAFLNMDATIQYAEGHNDPLSSSELTSDGPYNTYTRTGLPAGAIASPGYSALLAAVDPEDHNYYYYVAKPDGYHIFTSTLSEHNAAVAEARSMFE